MKIRKWIVLAGTAVLVTTLLSGIAFAWFTSEASITPVKITAGSLNIELSLETDPDTLYPLYPRAEWDIDGELPDDVLKIDYLLENDSDIDVLVKLNVADLLKNSTVSGVETDDLSGNVLYLDGHPERTILDRPDAVMFNFVISDDEGAVKVELDEDNLFVYIPDRANTTISLFIWIDGEKGGNEYQFADIQLGTLFAKATQYREAALASQSTFGLTPQQIADILNETTVPFA